MTTRTRVVPVPARGRPGDLVDGLPPGAVFTRREQWASSKRPDLAGWAGRLAAKLAVAELIGVDTDRPVRELAPDLVRIEIVPADHGPCRPTAGLPCAGPHGPAVVLHGDLDDLMGGGARPQVSISHSRALAVALAILER